MQVSRGQSQEQESPSTSKSLLSLALGVRLAENAVHQNVSETYIQIASSSELPSTENERDETESIAVINVSKWHRLPMTSADDATIRLPKWAARAMANEDLVQKTWKLEDLNSEHDDKRIPKDNEKILPVNVTHNSVMRETVELEQRRNVRPVAGRHVSDMSIKVSDGIMEERPANLVIKDVISTLTIEPQKSLGSAVLDSKGSIQENFVVQDLMGPVTNNSLEYIGAESEIHLEKVGGQRISDESCETDSIRNHVKMVGGQRISDESCETDSTQNHVKMVGGQRISDESCETDSTRNHVKMVGGQRISEESCSNQGRSHIKVNIDMNSLTETTQTASKISIKPVCGKNISVETSSDDTVKKMCIKTSKRHNATTESALLLCSMQVK